MVSLGLVGRLAARAGTIDYNYQTTLKLASGTDSLGLNGAVFDFQVDVSSSAVFTNQFMYPGLTMNNDATVTVTGASVAADNGTFNLPQLTFYPSYEGGYSDFFTTSGNQIYLDLPGGDVLLDFTATPTAAGLGANVGDTVNLADFGTSSESYSWFASNGATKYSQTDTSASATPATPVSPVPEPSDLALVVTGLCGLAVLRRKPR